MIDDSLLDDVLSGRTMSFDSGISELARLAGLASQLPFPGPDIEARARMTARFDDYITGRSRPGIGAWIAGWVGAGPRPRTAVQRLAAGGVLLLASASGASAATGQTPMGIATEIASFAENLAHNLRPGRDATSLPLATSTNTPSSTPTFTPTPTAVATATPTPPAPTTAPASPSSPPAAIDDSGRGGQARGEEPPATTPTPTPTVAPERQATYSAGDGGSVRLRYSGSSLSLVSVQPSHGWQFTVTQSSAQQLEVTFTNGGRRLILAATLQGGQPVVQLRTTLSGPGSPKLPNPAVTRIPTPDSDHEQETDGDQQEGTSE